jgi:membrane protein
MTAVSRLLLRHRRAWGVARDTVAGVFADGFTHAGNLAYLSLLTLFPFFIVVATVAGSLGRTDDGLRAVRGFLRAVPPEVAALVAAPIAEVIHVRASGGLLTFGILVTLWSVTGFIETIRAIIRAAYSAPGDAPPWRYRIGSLLVVFVAVLVMLTAFAAQVLLTGAETFVARLMPMAPQFVAFLGLGRLVPAALLFAALYAVFVALTPRRFRALRCPIWPGALVASLTWVGTTMAMPRVLGFFNSYTLTYGSLAGVIVALLYFYIIGLGLVIGANFNASLAKTLQRPLRARSSSLQRTGDTWPD